MNRVLEPEWLDRLSPEDPRAVGSRADLRRVNAWMGHGWILSRALRRACGGRPVRTLLDLGGGDGAFLLRLARRMAGRWKTVHAVVLDQFDLVADQTRRAFEQMGWSLEPVRAEAIGWLAEAGDRAVDVIVANLFLHHFTAEALARMFTLAAARAKVFAACDPRRAPLSWWGARGLALLGCNQVTRADARVSVRAGFAGRELSGLWPSHGSWRLEERRAGLFTHLFVARREDN